MTVSKVNPGTSLLGTMRGGMTEEVYATGQVDAGSETGGGSDRERQRSADVIIELQSAAHPDQLASKLEQSFTEAQAHAEALSRELASARASGDQAMISMVEQSMGAYLLVASLAAARADVSSTTFVAGQAERLLARAAGAIEGVRLGLEVSAVASVEAAAQDFARLKRSVASIAAHARAIAALATRTMRGNEAAAAQQRTEEQIKQLEKMLGDGSFIGDPKLISDAEAKLAAASQPQSSGPQPGDIPLLGDQQPVPGDPMAKKDSPKVSLRA